MQQISLCLIFVVLIVAVSACAPAQPVLEPNPHLQSVGDRTAKWDLRTCKHSVRSGEPQAIQPPLSPSVGAVGPSTNGAVIGSVAPLHRVWESEDAYRRAVEYCLEERGYRVTGWQ